MIKKEVCQICKEIEHKYRCPQCRIVYCSLDCYKKHKVTCQPIISVPAQNHLENTITPVVEKNTSPIKDFQLHEDESEDRVSQEQLQALGNCKELKDILHNPHLRQIMLSLVQGPCASKQLESAMQEPIFTEFADKCLAIVNNDRDVNAEC